MRHETEYMWNKDPICPHCDAEFPIWGTDHALDLSYDDGGHTMFECKSCHKEFCCVTIVEHKFHSAVSEDAADDDNYGPQESTEAA